MPRPRVAIVPTGDELVEPGQAPGPGQIRNSNAVMLHALAIQAGARRRVLPIAPDEPGPLGRILGRGLEADLLVVTGGVSAGQRDLVPAALDALGVKCIFHKVRLKPGKPLWFGIGPPRGDRPGALVFGLPGNPVSGLVGFLLFVKPALAVLAGKPQARLRLARSATHERIHPSRRSDHLLPRQAGRPGTTRPACRRSKPSTGRARPICAPRPRPTVSPSSPPAIAITRQVKLSISSP